MQSVKVRRGGISAGEAADVLRSELGGGYDVQPGDDGTVRVRKGMSRVKVAVKAEPGGTVFDVSGEGTSFFPLFSLVTKALSGSGLAKKTAAAIGGAEAFRDDS
jgi:hypothetical protein